MHNDDYEDDLNEDSDRVGSSENFGGSRGDETRERPRRSYRESQESARHAEGRERSASYQLNGDGDKGRVLLKAVNDVLNQFFPLKTLISAVEFEVFRDYIFQKVPDFAEDPVGFLSEIYPQRDVATDEKLDDAIDSILRELFFHAGGTLVGRLESRKTRLAKRIAYFSSAEHYEALMYRAGRLSRHDKLRDDLDLASQFETLLESGQIHTEDDSSGESGIEDGVENADDEKFDFTDSSTEFKDVVWRSTCDEAKEIAKRYFDGKPLGPYDFETFRRLFYLRARLEEDGESVSEFKDDLYDDVESAVNEVFTPFDEFDVSRLEVFFEELNDLDEDFLTNKTPAEIDEVALLALEIFRKRINRDDGAEFLTSDSDFSSEYSTIAKYVVKSRFSNRQFSRDFSDFDDFYKEFLRVAGPRAKATEEEVRAYFIAAGGSFRSEPIEAQEEKGPLTRSEAIKKVLVEKYPNGLDLFNDGDIDAFRQECENLGVELEPPVAKIRGAICRNAILCGLRAWSTSDDLRKKLGDAVDSILRNNTLVVYYESFFEKNDSWLISSGISDWRVLRSFIAARFPKHMFYERYFEVVRDKRGELYKVFDEILRLWGAPASVRTVDELVERSYIPRDLVQLVLESVPERFVPSGDGFTLADSSHASLKGDFLANGSVAFVDSSFYGDGKTFLRSLVDDVKDRDSTATKEAASTTKTSRSPMSERSESEKNNWHVGENFTVSSDVSVSNSDDDWRRQANLAAKILSQNFKEGLLLTDPDEIERFRALASEKNLDVSQSDDDLLKQLKRVGFICDERLYVVSKKMKEVVMNLVDSWFSQGGGVIYYDVFFERHQDVLNDAGIVTVEALKNRLWKYLPNYVFSEDGEYFTAKEDGRTVFEIIRDDLLLVWDGGSAKRVTELEKMVYAPRRALEKALRGYRDHFEVLLNGFWKRVDNVEKTSGAKKKDSKK